MNITFQADDGEHEIDSEDIDKIAVQYLDVTDPKKPFWYSGRSFPERMDPAARRVYFVTMNDGHKYGLAANPDEPGLQAIARIYQERFESTDHDDDLDDDDDLSPI